MLWAAPIAWVLMLPVAVACALLAWRGRPRVAATRLLLSSLLVAALAAPVLQTEQHVARVVHVVDTSSSLPPLVHDALWAAVDRDRMSLNDHDRLAVIQVDGRARILTPLTDATVPLPPPLDASPRASTALLDGLRQAAPIQNREAPFCFATRASATTFSISSSFSFSSPVL